MDRQFSLRFALFLFASDLALAVLALLLATQARYAVGLGRELGSGGQWGLPVAVYGIMLLIWSVTFLTLNVYNPRDIAFLSKELFKVLQATLFAWLVLAGVLYFSFRDTSRLQIIYFLGFYTLLIVTHRAVLRGIFLLRGGKRYQNRHVLIIGTGDIAQQIAGAIRARHWMGLDFRGFVGDPSATVTPVLGTRDETLQIVTQHQITEVIIALPRDEFDATRDLIYRLQGLSVNIRLVPDYFDMVFLRLNFEDFGGIPLLSLKEPVLDPLQRLVKRIFDLTIAVPGLIVALPVMGLVAITIRLDSAGPVLFKQQRVGEGGKLFVMIKFRTMRQNAEQEQEQVNIRDTDGNIIHKHADDPRITRVGRFLRRTSLDELPQLFNIITGKMSLVGPRPEMPWLVDLYEPWQRKRFEVPQGLTGWWQISGRSDKPMHLHTEDDLYYIRHYSLLLDVIIILRTIKKVLVGHGAY